MSNSELTEQLKIVTENCQGTGGIIIIQTEEGAKIAQIGLSEQEVYDNLCLAIYYAKSIELDREYRKSQINPN